MSKFEYKPSQHPALKANCSYLGTIAFKDSTEISNSRYLWLDYPTQELRWSVGTVPYLPCKRLSLSCVQSVSKIISGLNSGIKIQSKSHTLTFWLPNEKVSKTWVSELLGLIIPDENQKSKKPQESLLISSNALDIQSLKVRILNLVNLYLPNLQILTIDEAADRVREYLQGLLAENPTEDTSEEVKVLKEQLGSLQNKIRNIEEAKVRNDKYSGMEEEYYRMKGVRAGLSGKLDKIQQEKANLSREAKVMKNELSLVSIENKQNIKEGKNEHVISGLLFVNESERLVKIVPELCTLFLYAPEEFSAESEKILYSMVVGMTMEEGPVLSFLLIGNFKYNLSGDSKTLNTILKSYENYNRVTVNSTEKAFTHYMSICDESDRQLRYVEKHIKAYKSLMNKNICEVGTRTPFQDFYLSEISNLSEINIEDIAGISPSALKYLEEERPKLLKELKELVESL